VCTTIVHNKPQNSSLLVEKLRHTL